MKGKGLVLARNHESLDCHMILEGWQKYGFVNILIRHYYSSKYLSFSDNTSAYSSKAAVGWISLPLSRVWSSVPPGKGREECGGLAFLHDQ